MSKFVGIMMKYPIGIQSFEQLREDGYVYVDKTDLVYKLVTTGKIYFLSRPRRFGKSLLVSTLKNYFLGRRDLFEGLAISSLEKEWLEYHPEKLFPGPQGPVRGTGHQLAGEGVAGVSGVPYRLQFHKLQGTGRA